jgi:hypothetical protein
MMRLSSTSMRLVIGSIVAGIAAIVVLIMSQSGRPESPASTVAPAATTQGATPAPNLPLQDRQLGKVNVPEIPEDLLERILKEDKKLGLFMDHYRTILPSEEKRAEFHKLLSDPAMMNAMAEELMSPGDGHPKQEEYYRRLMQIDYFEAGLSWKDNPQREKLVDLTRDIIAKDNFQAGQDAARREILGGSKMELYTLLYNHDAQKAGELVAQAQGTRLEPLVNWIAQEDLRRRAEEQELQKKIDELARSN